MKHLLRTGVAAIAAVTFFAAFGTTSRSKVGHC